jgi:hypothetical protein
LASAETCHCNNSWLYGGESFTVWHQPQWNQFAVDVKTLRADVAELSSGMKVIENELAELDKNPFQDVRGCISSVSSW